MSPRPEDLLVGLVALALAPVVAWRIRKGLREGALPLYRTRLRREDSPGRFRLLLSLHLIALALVTFVAFALLLPYARVLLKSEAMPVVVPALMFLLVGAELVRMLYTDTMRAPSPWSMLGKRDPRERSPVFFWWSVGLLSLLAAFTAALSLIALRRML